MSTITQDLVKQPTALQTAAQSKTENLRVTVMPSVTHLAKANKVQMEDQIVTLRDINGHGTIETLSKEDTLDNGQL